MNLKLGIRSLLIKDFKTYYLIDQGNAGVGVGTIHVPLDVMMKEYGFEEIKRAIEELLKSKKGLAYYGILTNCRDKSTGDYSKEVLLYRPEKVSSEKSNDHFLEFAEYLDKHEGFNLSERKDDDSNGRVVTWHVGNLKYSRKDFEKIMTQFYSSAAVSNED